VSVHQVKISCLPVYSSQSRKQSLSGRKVCSHLYKRGETLNGENFHIVSEDIGVIVKLNSIINIIKFEEVHSLFRFGYFLVTEFRTS
jgi:hypothetical protein